MGRCANFALGIAIVVSSCGPRTLTWEFELDEEIPRRRIARIEASILRGGCDGEPLYQADFARDSNAAAPPELPDGRYGFSGSATDWDCAMVAEGCIEVDVPAEQVLVPLMRVATPDPECDSGCEQGRCTGEQECSDCASGMCVDG